MTLVSQNASLVSNQPEAMSEDTGSVCVHLVSLTGLSAKVFLKLVTAEHKPAAGPEDYC